MGRPPRPLPPLGPVPPLRPRPPIRPRARIQFGMPKGPLFVGSWHRVKVRLAAGLDPDEVVYTIPDGPKAGLISPSLERGRPPPNRELMLLVGHAPGTWTIEARHAVSGDLIGCAKYEVDALWRDKRAGPSFWFTGTTGGAVAGAAWGGGGAGPQNINVRPASGTLRCAIVLVDTTDQRFTTDATDLQGHRDRWLNETINGVTDASGVTRSCRHYFEEISFGILTLSGQVFGPAELPGAWSDYWEDDGAPKPGLWQACVTASDSLVDWRNFDTAIFVSQQVDGPPQKRAWPYANGGTFTTAEGNVNLGVISMPNEWGTGGNREIYDTLSHELGHNLGLPDLYTPAVTGRNVGSWELMDWDDPLPHISIAHRMMLGWIQPAWIRSFDFSALGGAVDQTVTLHPVATGTPAAGRVAGVEIRIADGWNYYFEYRVGQAAQIGDRALPDDSTVLGTDVISPPYTAPFSRPPILLLPPDGDPDGETFGNGENYRETDFSDPTFPTDFRVDVSGIDGSKADLRIRYGVFSKPDPSIRPWPASPDRQWQSPDIEVRNDRNATDPAWFNVPWAGNANTVVAKVKNAGGLNAPQVRCNFYVKNYNVGGTPEAFIGTDVRDVGPNATVEFSTGWTPPGEGHYCVIARIPLYQTPAVPPAVSVVEMTEFNNIAQSNYDRFISAEASPPSREVTFVEVGNPYPIATHIFLQPTQSNPMYRTYIEHTWLWLEPGETRQVRMMMEFAPDNLSNGIYRDQDLRKYRPMMQKPNRVQAVATIEDPNDSPRHKVDTLSGVDMEIVRGKATRFQRFIAEGPRVAGSVATVDGGQPAQGHALVRTWHGDRAKPEFRYKRFKLRSDGSFSGSPEHQGWAIDAYFVPAPGYGDCWSERIEP